MRNIFYSLSASLVILLTLSLLLTSSLHCSAQEQLYCRTFLAGDTSVHFASVVINNQPAQPTADAGNNGSEIAALSWTTVSSSAPGNTTRSLFYFNVSALPAGAEVTSAKLYLFAKKDNTEGNLGNPKYGSRNGYLLQAVTGSWTPSGMSWNGQPETDGHHEKTVPDSRNPLGNDTIDITDMVQSWVVKPAKNHGMLLRLKTEKVYDGSFLHPVAVPQSGARAAGLTVTTGSAGQTDGTSFVTQTGEAIQGVSFRVHTANDFTAMPVLANSVIFYGAQSDAAVQPRLVVCYKLKTDITVTLFPSPADASTQLNFVAPTDGTALAEILDMSGHVLLLRQATVFQGNNTLSFTDLSKLSGGIYIMKLALNGNITTKKFTIVH